MNDAVPGSAASPALTRTASIPLARTVFSSRANVGGIGSTAMIRAGLHRRWANSVNAPTFAPASTTTASSHSRRKPSRYSSLTKISWCSSAAPRRSTVASTPPVGSATSSGSSPLSTPPRGRTWATSAARSVPSSATHTTAWSTSGLASIADSTSPSSIRLPRSFTCPSARPRYSSTPSGRSTAMSPVRYSRPPGGPNGSGTKRSAVSPGLPQ